MAFSPIDLDGAARVGNDAAHGGEPEPSAGTRRFVVKKRWKILSLTSGLMPIPVSCRASST